MANLSRPPRWLFQLLQMTKSSMLASAKTTCARLRKSWNYKERVTNTPHSNSNSFHFTHVQSVKVNLLNIAASGAFNKTGSKCISSSAVVKCQKHEILCCYLTFKGSRLRLHSSKKLMMRVVSHLNKWGLNSFWAASPNLILNLSKQEKLTSAKVVMVKFN